MLTLDRIIAGDRTALDDGQLIDVEPGEPPRSRVGRRELITRTAGRSGLPSHVVSAVYSALIEELVCAVSAGDTVGLFGFGRFYRQDHKGHQVRFGQTSIDDYPVLKFSASRSLNRALGAAPLRCFSLPEFLEDFEPDLGVPPSVA